MTGLCSASPRLAAPAVLLLGGVVTAVCTPATATPDRSGMAGSTGPIDGWDADQVANAATIVAVGTQRDVPPHGWVIAVATAMQESGVRNLPDGDGDSVGLFQQRPSQGWGTSDELQDPAYAAGKFYDRLLTVPGLANHRRHRRRASGAAVRVPRRIRQMGGRCYRAGAAAARRHTGRLRRSASRWLGHAR